MRSKYFCAAILSCVLLLAACSDLFQKAFELPPDPQGLTVFNLPAEGNFTVYVYPDTVDISSYTALTGVMNAKEHLAIGPHHSGETFNLFAVDGLSLNTEWKGSGLLPVILFNADGDDSDEDNPRYGTATIKFTDGIGKVYFGGFAPITGEGRGLTVHGLSEVSGYEAYEAYVFNGGTNVFMYGSHKNADGEYTRGAWFEHTKHRYQAQGLAVTGHTFPLYIWNGTAEFGQWSGSGSLPVLLVNPAGDALDEDNPYYRRAMINFTHGVGVVDFDKFAPVVDSIPDPDPDKGLTITGLLHDNYYVYVFISGVNVSGYTAVESAVHNNRYTAVGELNDNGDMFELFNSSSAGIFVGNGVYQVILEDTSISGSSQFLRAVVSMSAGTGEAAFADFTELAPPDAPQFYYIAYNKNEDAANGFMAPAKVFFGEPKQLDGNNFTLLRHGFLGWSLAADGEVVYANRDEVVDICDTVGGTITLYAQWEPLQYYVRYEKNDPNPAGALADNTPVMGNMPPSNHQYNFLKELSPVEYTRAGYKFTGWNTRPNGSGVWYVDKEPVLDLHVITGDTFYLYAQWRPITYRVAYDFNDPSRTSPPPRETEFRTYDVKRRLLIGIDGGDVVTRWNTKSNGSGVNYYDQQWAGNMTLIDEEIVTLYAVEWDELSYTITVKYNNKGQDDDYQFQLRPGETIEDDAAAADIAALTDPPPPRNAYKCKFNGWYTWVQQNYGDEWDGESYGEEWELSRPIDANIVLVAKWVDYAVYDIGPGGGVVFYAAHGERDGFTMTDNGEICYYLEATNPLYPTVDNSMRFTNWVGSPGDWESMQGSFEGFEKLDLLTSDEVGAGRKNTADIIARFEELIAAGELDGNMYYPLMPVTCRDFTGGGFNDWFLPSYNELYQLCLAIRIKHGRTSPLDDFKGYNPLAQNVGFTNALSSTIGPIWSDGREYIMLKEIVASGFGDNLSVDPADCMALVGDKYPAYVYAVRAF